MGARVFVVGAVRLAAAGLLLLTGQTSAARVQEPFSAYCRHSARESRLLQDLADGSLDRHSCIEAALVAAGHNDPAMIADLQARYQELAVRCRSLLSASSSLTERAAVVLRFLHADVLRGRFESHLFDVGQTLINGDFNCLTATLLFQSLCHEFGVPTQALWQPAHVRCWLCISRERGVIIETTTSEWSGITSVEASGVGPAARRLTSAELIGKVFYNRGVTAMRDKQYALALGATWVSCQLDPQDDQAQSNLRACLNNWALETASAGDMEAAGRLFEEGLRLDPEYQPFHRNRAYLRRISPGA